MTEMTRGLGGSDSDARPDAAAGDMPSESDLPRMQGLDEGGPEDADDATPGESTVDESRASGVIGGTGRSSSDPMPDMGGTGGA